MDAEWASWEVELEDAIIRLVETEPLGNMAEWTHAYRCNRISVSPPRSRKSRKGSREGAVEGIIPFKRMEGFKLAVTS